MTEAQIKGQEERKALEDALRKASMRAFLTVLARNGNVSAAAREAGIAAITVRRWRKESEARPEDDAYRVDWPAGDEPLPFFEHFQGAIDVVCDEIEGAMIQRAIEGVEEPIYFQGKKVGSQRRPSDINGMFILKRWRHDYRDNHVEVTHKGRLEITDDSRNALADKMLAQLERRAAAGLLPAPDATTALPVIDVEAVPVPVASEEDKE